MGRERRPSVTIFERKSSNTFIIFISPGGVRSRMFSWDPPSGHWKGQPPAPSLPQVDAGEDKKPGAHIGKLDYVNWMPAA